MSDDVRDAAIRIEVAVGKVRESVARIEERCGPCRDEVQTLSAVVRGDNGAGHGARLARLEEARGIGAKATWAGVALISAIIATVVSQLM